MKVPQIPIKTRLKEEVSGMFGQYTHSVDAKGRLFVPAKLRDELGDSFYLMIGTKNSLLVFPEARMAKAMESFNASPITRDKRHLLANVAKIEPDKQGRFVVPPTLRNYAHLTGDVTFLGQGDYAEIWDAETYASDESGWLEEGNLDEALKGLWP